MKARKLIFGLYADRSGLNWVEDIIRSAACERGVCVQRTEVCSYPDADIPDYGFLGDQWRDEHPGKRPEDRRPVELRATVPCSLRVWRALRKEVLRRMCPEGNHPHTCEVPWMAM